MAELNLIPYELRKDKYAKVRIWRNILVSVLVLLVVGASCGLPYYTLKMLKAKEAELKAEASKGSAILKESDTLQGEIANYNGRIEKAEIIINQRIIVNQGINGLAKYMPADMKIENLNLSKGVMTINGNAKNYASIPSFAANIQEIKEFKSVRIDNITYNQSQGVYGFALTINY